MTYRSDIDGLRAIAVGLVILFHCGFGVWSGGFIGVDVFFVISGFLITGIIADETKGGSFRLGHFWMRRVRRLFVPAWVVIAACLVAFWFVYPPHYYRDLAESALAQLVFASNFLFFHESGYFDTASHVKPLLHTWSLAVEEQFYVLFPLMVLACLWLWKRLPLWPVLLLTAASFVLSVLVTPGSPSAAFFLLPTRAWELGVGCCLALIIRTPRAQTWSPNRWIHEVVAASGLAMILAASLLYSPRTSFPSWLAAVPVIGTAMVIWAGHGTETFVGRLLAWRPIVFVGLISYSLYLWHWPAIVLQRAVRSDLPTSWENLAAVLVSGVLAWLSYRYLETPVRRRLDLFPPRRLLIGALVGMAIIGAASASIVISGGASERREVVYQDPLPYARQNECFDQFEADGSPRFCNVGREDGPIEFVAIGDSHNRAILPAIEAMALRDGKRGLFASTSGCLPLRGLYMPGDPDGTRKCRSIVDAAYKMVGDGSVPTIILTARWSYYIRPARSDGTFKPVSRKPDGPRTPAASQRAFNDGWRTSVSELISAGVLVVVIDQVPHQPFYPAEFAWRAQALGAKPERLSVTLQDHDRDQETADAIIRSIPGVVIMDPTDIFCSKNSCPMFSGRDSLYFDDDHLSQLGAAQIVNWLKLPEHGHGDASN